MPKGIWGESSLAGAFCIYLPDYIYMNILLTILAVIGGIFIVYFFIGFLLAAITGSDSKRIEKAEANLSKIDEDIRKTLFSIYLGYFDKNVDRVNTMVNKAHPDHLKYLIYFFSFENRPPEYSSGKTGQITWKSFENELHKSGYNSNAAKILTGVIMENYNEVLDKKIKEMDKERQPKILNSMPTVLQVELVCQNLDKENYPKLYSWYKSNPESLKERLVNIAEKWHDNNITSAAQSLESDMEHG
jgi:hypothetical protein